MKVLVINKQNDYMTIYNNKEEIYNKIKYGTFITDDYCHIDYFNMAELLDYNYGKNYQYIWGNENIKEYLKQRFPKTYEKYLIEYDIK